MSWEMLQDKAIQTFIQDHQSSDVKQLGLMSWPDKNWPKPLILDQIKARQKTAHKLPTWHEQTGIIFPPSDIVEQASSEATAKFKASLFATGKGLDLTGGCGIDSWAFAQHCTDLDIIEQHAQACAQIQHNLPQLETKANIHTHHCTAEDFIAKALQANQSYDFIYIDPQRRTENKRGLYKLEDCTPNIIDLLPSLKQLTHKLVVKTSPMLSIEQAQQTLPHLSDVYCIEWDGQCKEILLVFDTSSAKQHTVKHHAVILNHDGTAKTHLTSSATSHTITYSDPQTYLYEPAPALQKSKLMAELAAQYQLQKLAPNTHLFTSETLVADFPGRYFKIESIAPVQKKSLNTSKANLTIRNFPSDIATLRKKLKLKEGGDLYIYACTLIGGEKRLILCRKDCINI